MAHAIMLSSLRVTVCTIDEEYIGQFTSFGSGDGELIWPTSIAVDQEVNVYVSDERRHDVQMFDSDGNFLRHWGSMGGDPGQFNRPSGLATDVEGNVLVVDSLNNRIQRFDSRGQVLQVWGEAGSAPGQFNFPWGIAVDRQGRIYVADWRNGRVQQLDAAGNHLASFGDRDGQVRLERPAGVEVDSVGNLYVSDYGRDVVQVYQADGQHLTTLLGDGSMTKWAAPYIAADPEMSALREQHADEVAAQERLFEGPLGLAVDDQDRIIIADCCKHRLQVYQRT
jgi:DNA-binding beta-propeller fold protein YncE